MFERILPALISWISNQYHVSKCSYTNLEMAFVYFLNKQHYCYY